MLPLQNLSSCNNILYFSLQQIMRGGLGVLIGVGFMDLFTYFENDLDKVLTLFVPLIRRWYEDDSVALKVC